MLPQVLFRVQWQRGADMQTRLEATVEDRKVFANHIQRVSKIAHEMSPVAVRFYPQLQTLTRGVRSSLYVAS